MQGETEPRSQTTTGPPSYTSQCFCLGHASLLHAWTLSDVSLRVRPALASACITDYFMPLPSCSSAGPASVLLVQVCHAAGMQAAFLGANHVHRTGEAPSLDTIHQHLSIACQTQVALSICCHLVMLLLWSACVLAAQSLSVIGHCECSFV